ncbi:MAG: apolipoprotein N-acyltransferase [Candidatus Brocadia sp. AMX2]|nr:MULTISPECIES: apolipoprotein N-acyltransferase [Brocadia]KXK30198.1 MAG: apolipoprotein N-acyltransferase [Candidatus Brocadia sinica]MBC6930731.1 apolipoprotein N-acyltransferase [Candidatus Brocadia sp.]MBL1167699.1 apolipoprotein N-acyltransferase [Candidatus Brocadia sp. AMX1]KAA0245627.1 MAG: apolipoprotein N-acyltransferase [Candidatus Brocadia sp. AMX2]MCE7865406.1 apolipoprotein N-acyltransferase [Candidatus Brocadia sp. AMX2]
MPLAVSKTLSKTNFVKILILSLLTILFLCLSFPPADLGYLAWIAFIPWLFLMVTEERYICLTALFVGAVFFFIQLSWLRHIAIIAWILLSSYCSAYFLTFAFCTRFIVFRLKYPLVIVAPAIWIALEFIRSFLLSGFPWFFIGHTQSQYLPVIQVADITGVYGISFVIVTANAALVDLIICYLINRRKIPPLSPHPYKGREKESIKNLLKREYFAEQYAKCLLPGRKCIFFNLTCTLPLTLLTAVLLYGLYCLNHYEPEEGPIVCMVQGNIPQDLKFESTEEDQIQILKKYADLSKGVKGRAIDLLVWPETMMPGLLNINPELTGRKIDFLSQLTATQLAQDLNTNLLFGGIALTLAGEEQVYFNSAYYYNRGGTLLDRYDKVHLVPFGEFTPLKRYFPFLANLVPYEIGLTSGNKRTLFHLDTLKNGSFTFGSSICYEDTVPSLIRKFKKDGADFMLNITNDGWFRDSAELDQHLAIMVFRAIENRICMARAANTGISSFVAPDGTIYDKLSDGRGRYREISGTLINCIKFVKKYNPFYTIYGDWFAILCTAATGIVLFIAILKSRVICYQNSRRGTS